MTEDSNTKEDHGKRRHVAIRLMEPWRRFVRLRANGRSRIACAWQQPALRCCREMGRVG